MVESSTVEQAEWLGQVTESIVEPERPICDPHHHLWDHPDRRYLLDQLLGDTESGHRIVSTVFVECGSMFRVDGPEQLRPVGETEFVNGVAAMTASGGYGEIRACAGIIGFADLNLGRSVGEVLDRHMASSTRFRGIRHAAGWDSHDDVRNSHSNPFAGMLHDTTFRKGIGELERRGLCFEAWLYHPQIPEIAELARAFPSLSIVLDHFGGPLGIGPYEGKREEIHARWQKDITELARCPNVTAKLGGLLMPINGFGFHKRPRPATSDEIVEVTGRYYQHVIECFGADRCMFESNFPVDKQSCSYAVLWNAFKKMVAHASESEKSALFHDTATRVYRLVE